MGEAGVACLDDLGPERSVRQMQDPLTSMPGDGRGDLEQAVTHAFGFLPPGGLVGVAQQPSLSTVAGFKQVG